MIVAPASSGTFPLRCLGTTAVCILVAATLFACTGGDEDSTRDEQALESEGTALERTVRLVEDSGGEVHYVDHSEREDRSVLVTPVEFVDGETPLIVSLHGFGGNSADQIAYVPLHERVNTDGFASAAAQRDSRQRGKSLLESHRPVLRWRQERRG